MEHLWQIQHSYLIPLLPLIGAAIAGFFGARWLKGQSHWPIWIGVGASAIISLSLLFSMLNLAKGEGHEAAPAAGEHAAAAENQPASNGLYFNKVFFHWISAGDSQAAGSSKYFNADAGFLF